MRDSQISHPATHLYFNHECVIILFRNSGLHFRSWRIVAYGATTRRKASAFSALLSFSRRRRELRLAARFLWRSHRFGVVAIALNM